MAYVVYKIHNHGYPIYFNGKYLIWCWMTCETTKHKLRQILMMNKYLTVPDDLGSAKALDDISKVFLKQIMVWSMYILYTIHIYI